MSQTSPSLNLLHPEVGALIDGHRVVRSSVAAGGTGIIHEVIDAQGRRCALKVLNREKILQFLREQRNDITEQEVDEKYQHYVQLFKGEFQKLVGLIHPHVAEAYSFGFCGDHFYFTTEFIEGKPLATYLQNSDPQQMIPLFLQTLEGLDFMHKAGLIHLDIKSENVLVQQKNGKPQVKIIDLGLTMAPEDYKGQFFGSVHYMAPEVALGKIEEVDARADLFSFGVLMYFCLTRGMWPFPRTAKKDPEAVRKQIEREELSELPSIMYFDELAQKYPPYLDRIIVHLLQKNPQERFYPTARAVMNALLSKSPDAFQKTPAGSYLIPEGDQHIGRKKERTLLENYVLQVLEDRHVPIVFVEGEEGMGKSHFLQKLKQYTSQDAEKLAVHQVQFPADLELCNQWKEQILSHITENTKPVVVLVDDIQRLYQKDAQYTSLQQFFDGLFRLVAERKTKPEMHLKSVPVLVVATYPSQDFSLPAFTQRLHLPHEAIEKVSLQAFTLQEVREYLEKTPALKGHELPLERIKVLHRQTKGIPAEIKEHLSLIDSQGLLFDLEGRILFRLPQKEKQQVSSRTEARLFEAYQMCDVDEARILKLIAVWNWKHLALPPTYSDIATLLPESLVKQKLNELVRREILTHDSKNNAYSFYEKDFLPSLIYRSMPVQERYQWHQKILALYQAEKKPKELCLLHQAFMEPCPATYRALTQLSRIRQSEKGDITLALQLAEHGLKLAGSHDRLKAHFAYLLISYYLQTSAIEKACSLASSIFKQFEPKPNFRIEKIRFALQLSVIALYQQQLPLTYEFLQKAKSLLHKEELTIAPTVLSLTVLNTEAQYYYELGRANTQQSKAALTQSRTLFEQSHQLEKMLPEHAKKRVYNHTLGVVLIALGEYQEAISYLHAAYTKYKNAHYFLGQMECAFFLATAYRLLGKYEESLAYTEQMLSVAQHISHHKWIRLAYSTLADIYHDTDRFDLALKANDHFLAAAALQEDESSYKRTATICWSNKGHCYKELKQFDRAMLHFEAMLEASPQPIYLMWAYEGMGEICFRQQNFERSDEYLKQAEELLENVPEQASEAYRFPIRLMRAQILYQRGEKDEARKMLLQLQPMAQKQANWSSAYSKVEKDLNDYSWLTQQKQ